MSEQKSLTVEKCKWHHNRKSPVILMIDDLANTWVDLDGDGIPGPGEDWGAMGMKSGSAIDFLMNEVLRDYPEVKATFFVPVGIRTGVVRESHIPVYSRRMDEDHFIREFFSTLHRDSRFELAYHGTDHGIPGASSEDFIQEWCTYRSLDEAVKTISQGKEIFFNAVGAYPTGGKYCGYDANDFSDQSVNMTGFLWWSRNACADPYGNNGRFNPEEGDDIPDISYFGDQFVVNIPATLPGSLFNEAWEPSGSTSLKRGVKTLLSVYYIRRGKMIIDTFVEQERIISISEHIAPSRNDGKIQMPNIYTDQRSLLMIFEHLSKKSVWYCTGTELAHYVRARDFSEIATVGPDSFRLQIKDARIENNPLSLKIEGDYTALIQPDGVTVPIVKGIADIRVLAGTYHVK